jgi:hypothetical protein
VIRKVKNTSRESGNERDLYLQLLTSSYVIEHIVGTALERERKVQATVGLYTLPVSD